MKGLETTFLSVIFLTVVAVVFGIADFNDLEKEFCGQPDLFQQVHQCEAFIPEKVITVRDKCRYQITNTIDRKEFLKQLCDPKLNINQKMKQCLLNKLKIRKYKFEKKDISKIMTAVKCVKEFLKLKKETGKMPFKFSLANRRSEIPPDIF